MYLDTRITILKNLLNHSYEYIYKKEEAYYTLNANTF